MDGRMNRRRTRAFWEQDDDDDDDDDDYQNDVPKRVPKRTEACFYFTISFVCPNHYVIVFGVQ